MLFCLRLHIDIRKQGLMLSSSRHLGADNMP